MHLEFLKISHKKSDLSFPKDRSFSRLKVQFLYEFYFDFIPYGNCAFCAVFFYALYFFAALSYIAALYFPAGISAFLHFCSAMRSLRNVFSLSAVFSAERRTDKRSLTSAMTMETRLNASVAMPAIEKPIAS